MSTPNCEKCYDVGEILPAGPSDAPITMCDCSMGEFLMRRMAEAAEAERQAIAREARAWAFVATKSEAKILLQFERAIRARSTTTEKQTGSADRLTP